MSVGCKNQCSQPPSGCPANRSALFIYRQTLRRQLPQDEPVRCPSQANAGMFQNIRYKAVRAQPRMGGHLEGKDLILGHFEVGPEEILEVLEAVR